MEIKKVIPVSVKPVGVVAPVSVKPVVPVAKVVAPAVVKTVAQPAVLAIPVVQATEIIAPKEEVKGGLFSKPSVADVPKEERLADVKGAVNKVKNKKAEKPADDNDEDDNDEESEDGTETKSSKGKKVKKFEGPRSIRVYGQELYVEENSKVELEAIRKKIVEEFHYPEFSKERTVMSVDEETGIVVPVIKFEKRG